MADVKGFRGYRFNAEVVGSLDLTVTPPYDVINPEQRLRLADQSPYNMVHVILPKEGDGVDQYTAAGNHLRRWLADRAMTQDDADSMYLIEQRFALKDGCPRLRRGFYAVTRIPEPGESIVLGHERTFAGPVEDRLKLMQATQANFGAIFVLYADPAHTLAGFYAQAAARPPDNTFTTMDGAETRVWKVPGSPEVTAFFADKRLYIADGHHRFKTACFYRDQMREQHGTQGVHGYDYVLMGFVPFDDPGLVICPPHRVVTASAGLTEAALLEALSQWFTVAPVNGPLAEAVEQGEGCRLGLKTTSGAQFLLTLKPGDRREFLGDDHSEAWRNLDVAVLHRGVLARVMNLPEGAEHLYEHDAERALAAAGPDTGKLAFLLPPMHPDQVRACAEAGDPMPQKATYFFPKLPTGAVIYRHE